MPHYNRRKFLKTGLASMAATAAGPVQAANKPMNVLFIAVDDLRPELGCYGASHVQSPHIDRLASQGTLFNRAYCQQAVCSPSRTSLMTGRRPDSTRVWDLETNFRDTIPDVVTLSQQFMRHGYHAESMGKIYHGRTRLNDPQSWSVDAWFPNNPAYQTGEGQAIFKNRGDRNGLPVEAPDVPDNALQDGATADRAVQALRRLKDQPFFLATGFFKPHLPFVAPKKYFDLYNRADIEPADNPLPPKDSPEWAWAKWGELRKYWGMPQEGPVSDAQARELIHGYQACVSYTDAQIGRVISELDRLGLRDNTVIVLWGDHGWQLGDHGWWCKHTNYETSAHAPLIISVPGQQPGVTNALVEFVDIYPTLCEVCGIPLPEGLEGDSFQPLVEDPEHPWKTAAFSQYPRSIPGIGRGMGYSMRTDWYRFTEWSAPGNDFRAYELYDHQRDSQEDVNIAGHSANAELVKQLTRQLHAGWQAARPAR
jgi:iduronate 2-sulfatase